MGLLDNLQKQSPKTSRVHDAEPSSGYVVFRTSKQKLFDLALLKDKDDFEKLLDEVDASEILKIQFTPDLMKVRIVWVAELRKLNRKEHDAEIPVQIEIKPDVKLPDAISTQTLPPSQPYEGIKL